MKFALCLAAMITLLLPVDGPLPEPAAAAPNGKCVTFCSSWCAKHARAQDDCNARCTLTHCS
jgi:hypothetical protein